MNPLDSLSQDGWQLLIAATWPFLQEMLKSSKLAPWLSEGTKLRNHLVSITVATCATLGLHYTVSGNAAIGWSFALHIPPLSALAHVAGQWLGQHGVYTTLIKNPAVEKAILEELKLINARGAAAPALASAASGS